MKINSFTFFLVMLCTSFTINAKNRSSIDTNEVYLLVGTYNSVASKGIYLYRFDTVSGDSRYVSMIELDNPSYFTLSGDEKYIYAVSESSDIHSSGVYSIDFDKTKGEFTLLNFQNTQAEAPCYIETSPDSKFVLTANYSGGSITVFDVKANGELNNSPRVINFEGKSLHPKRPTHPHLHCVRFTPDNQHIVATDLGTDNIYVFPTDKAVDSTQLLIRKEKIQTYKVEAGSGPRHIDFHPNGKYMYLLNEISGSVIAFGIDNGKLEQFQTIKVDSLNAGGSGDIHVSSDGRFMYASNRLKGDGLAILAINPADGTLRQTGYQQTAIHPRNFIISPNQKFVLVAARDGGVIQVFSRDNETGLLTDTHKDIYLDKPVCLKFASIENY